MGYVRRVPVFSLRLWETRFEGVYNKRTRPQQRSNRLVTPCDANTNTYMILTPRLYFFFFFDLPADGEEKSFKKLTTLSRIFIHKTPIQTPTRDTNLR